MKNFLLLTTSLTTCSFLALGLGQVAYANPEGGVVTAGQANIQTGANRVDIHQSSDKAVIDWRSFNVNKGETTEFHQPNSSSLTVNRIHDSNPSKILGNLSANGNVVLINQAGISFGKDAVVDVNSLVATTSDITNANAMAGNLDFNIKSNSSAKIINEGTITAKEAGLVGLVAPRVENSGVINAKLGKVHLGSAEKFTLDLYGDGAMSVAVSEDMQQQLIAHTGTINAEGGVVQLTAAAGSKLVTSLVQLDGEINTPQANEVGGKIIISGHDDTVVSITGELNADGATGGQISISAKNIMQQGKISAAGTNGQGGQVDIHFKNAYLDSESAKAIATGKNGNGGAINVIGETNSRAFISGQYDASSSTHAGGKVQITADNGDVKLYGAKVKADGKDKGGKINIGGEYQGTGTLKHAKTTSINYATTISADATDNGKGGDIVVWSKDTTLFGGTAQARGGVNGGDGGAIEISSKDTLKIAGNATTTAAARKSGYQAGQLLLDPKNITIATEGIQTGGISYFEVVDPNPDGFFLTPYVLTNGNVVLTDSSDGFSATYSGAAYLFNGATGGLISTLTGSQVNDQVGSYGVTSLNNGNYVVRSDYWINGSEVGAGAVTWGSGTTGVSGVVSAANSLVGTYAANYVGGQVVALPNGNYVVVTTSWSNGVGNTIGAYTWANGTTGITGAISSANSLVGSTQQDATSAKIKVLANGNYVITNPLWDNGSTVDVGAVTWGSGTSGITGVISASNSLIGASAGDMAGGLNGVTALTNGNYVVSTTSWDNGAVANVGAATWANGLGGTVGTISAANSLIGSTANDQIGASIGVLTNGNYVVNSTSWDNGAVVDAGSSTWANGLGGTIGTVTAANSLVGSNTQDYVGSFFTALTNGNYVVYTNRWRNGANTMAGAVTWGNGLGGTVGAVSAANSLVGSRVNDQIGSRVLALTNGNYVVSSWSWDNGATADVGAVTWGNGAGGTVGVLNATNSLIGTRANDRIGNYGVEKLANGNYVIRSGNWDNGAAIADAGAITWGNGAGGTVGTIDATNSLVGSRASDNVGSGAFLALSNGNYVVGSQNWDNGTISNAGAVTWGNGFGGTVGVLSASNSLIGSTASDGLGGTFSLVELTNGNYVVSTTMWDNGTISNAGAVTWGNGATGVFGTISATNSLVGSTANDRVGVVYPLSNGNYIVISNTWDSPASVDSGAITLGNGLGGTVGTINSTNSMFMGGSIPFNVENQKYAEDAVNDRVYIMSNLWTMYSFSRSFATLGTHDSYSDLAGADITLSPNFITNVLNAGTSVTLQANNDITVDDDIIANNASGDGGDLTLQAGRSILINANIVSDNGNVYLLGNQKLSTGVVNAYRAAGNAVITMASGTSINAGTGDVVIRLDDGAGLTNDEAGDITLAGINAGSILVQNVNTTGDVVLDVGSALATSGTGDAITLVSARNFINNSNASALAAASGRWLIYSSNPTDSVFGGITSDFRRYSCTYGGSCPTYGTTGNGFMYRYTPTLTVTPDALANIQYGDSVSLNGYAYSVSGYLDAADEADDVLTGSLNGSTTYVVGSNVGTYNLDYASGTLASEMGYALTYADNSTAITVDKKDITASFNGTLTKTYGDVNPTIDYNDFTFSGLVGSDSASLFNSILADFGLVDANTSVSTGNIVSATIGSTSNYNITNTPSTTLSITPRALTVSTNNASKTLPAADPIFTGSHNLTAYDAALISWAYSPAGYSGLAGTYTIEATATDASSRLSNYTRMNSYGNFIVNPDPSTIPPTIPVTPETGMPNTVVYMSLGGYLRDTQIKTAEKKENVDLSLGQGDDFVNILSSEPDSNISLDKDLRQTLRMFVNFD